MKTKVGVGSSIIAHWRCRRDRDAVLSTTKGILHVIKGETDQAIISVEGAVGKVEVKNLNMSCCTPREQGEILAEDKGLSERHKNRVVGVQYANSVYPNTNNKTPFSLLPSNHSKENHVLSCMSCCEVTAVSQLLVKVDN
eukprot:scaffold4399_cov175-Ochromonas_danica.AAC.17